jgi:ADP-dependent NAD(P)H-hydrate dehydratase / NAD(P)H-hydrate epimerase
MKITTAEEMRTIDRLSTEKYHVPSLGLMENAGTAVAQVVHLMYPNLARVAVVCGKGNNGGDGFVAARKLHQQGRVVEVLLCGSPEELKGDAANMFARLPVKPVILRTPADIQAEMDRGLGHAELIIDAVLGTGVKPPVTGMAEAAIRAINFMRAPVVAVDLPSGAPSDIFGGYYGLYSRANVMVTFTAPRPAHIFGLLTSGPLFVAQIGSPEEAVQSALKLEVVTPLDVARLLVPRPLDAAKGQFGRVLILGGSIGKAGAAGMAGLATLRSGAGLATVAIPTSVLSTVAMVAPEIMTEPLAETIEGTISLKALDNQRLEKLLEYKTAVAIGPGISINPETVQFVRAAVQKINIPIVLDADGLNAFAGALDKLDGSKRPLILTPHSGEMSRLMGIPREDIEKARIDAARKLASARKLIVVLKGHPTVVALPDGRCFANPTGNPAMATAGSGDILTGLILGMLSQFPEKVVESVCAAVYLHGLAGDVARDALGEQSVIATDLVRYLPEAIRRAKAWAEQKVLRVY